VDKFSGYVIASYVVVAVVLFAYLGWLWWRLRQEQAAQVQVEQAQAGAARATLAGAAQDQGRR
jgi:hypothetical protein